MTKVQVIPETILWEHIAFRLGRKSDNELSWRKHFVKLPDSIDLSEEFLRFWERNVTVAVQQRIVEDFGMRPFLFMENDQVVRRTVLDPEFWTGLDLCFSRRAVDRIWEDVVGRTKGMKPAWRDVTPADALFLCILDKRLFDTYSFEWLGGNNSEWPVTALFLCNRTFENPKNLPWSFFFHQYKKVPLPLREVLIEKTAAFFESLAAAVLSFSGGGEPVFSHPSQDQGSAGWGTDGRSFGVPSVRFSFADGVELLRAGLEDPYQTEAVRVAVNHWATDGTLGLDDGRYIEGACARSGLLKKIGTYDEEVLRYREIVQEGGLS